MSEYVTGFSTVDGIKKYDYNALANKPELNTYAITNTTIGEIITVTDAIKRGFGSFNIYGKTIQDGTPTPEAPVELVSAGDSGDITVNVISGKNLMLLDAIKQQNAYHNFYCYEDDGLYLIPGTYTVSIGEVCDGIYVNAYKSDTSLFKGYSGKSLTFTLTESKRVWFNFYRENATFASSTASTIQLEVGSVPTTYKSYVGQSMTIATPNGLPGVPVTFGGNYTDANGQQWICDEIDFWRGVYIKRINTRVFTGAEEFKLYQPELIYYERFALTEYALDGGLYKSLCTHLPYSSGELTGEVGQRFRKGTNNQNRIYFSHPNFTTVDAFVSFVEQAYSAGTPLSIVYALNTPIETPLSEEELAAYRSLYTYRDYTTVSNDAGTWMELEYVMDSKKYIDGLATGTILPARVE